MTRLCSENRPKTPETEKRAYRAIAGGESGDAHEPEPSTECRPASLFRSEPESRELRVVGIGPLVRMRAIDEDEAGDEMWMARRHELGYPPSERVTD